MSILKPININTKTAIVYEPGCGEALPVCALNKILGVKK